MIISGIVVASRPEHLAGVKQAVGEIPWADVHFSDPAGRLVVTIEAADLDQSMDRLLELQRLPRVLMAELAQYCIEDEVRERESTGTEAEREAAPPIPVDPDSQ